MIKKLNIKELRRLEKILFRYQTHQWHYSAQYKYAETLRNYVLGDVDELNQKRSKRGLI